MEKPLTKKQFDKKLDEKFSKFKKDMGEYFDQKFDQKFEEKFQELKDHSEVLVENVSAEVGGAYRDELEMVKDRVTRLERKTGLAGFSRRIV